MSVPVVGEYAIINGMKMYFERHGEGRPLLLIHGGGSTIDTSFGRIIQPLSQHRQVIAAEMQAHGRTDDRTTPLSFEQDADDIAALLKHLGLPTADFLGFSNGAQTCVELWLRHPGIIGRLVLASGFYSRDAVAEPFWEGFNGVTLDMMPLVLRQGFLAVNNDPAKLQRSFDRDVERMKKFNGWTDDQLRSILAPTLLITGNHDVGSLEHCVSTCRLIPNSQLAVFPGGHGTYMGTLESVDNGQLPLFNVVPLLEEFLG